MGNLHFLSDEECDDCNALFSVYENHLARFMGATRTIHGADGKSRIPTFVSPDQSFTASKHDFYGTSAIKIERQGDNSQHIMVDMEKGQTIFTYDKLPYKPQFVFKALLKMILSLVSLEDLTHYARALPYLTQSNTALKSVDPIALFTLPVENIGLAPYALLFERKHDDQSIPHHIGMIHLEHFIFHFVIPFHDQWPSKSDAIRPKIPACPPLSFRESFKQAKISAQHVNLSRMDEVTESASFGFEMINITKNDLIAYDPATGKEVDSTYDPTSIKGIIIVTDPNFSLPLG